MTTHLDVYRDRSGSLASISSEVDESELTMLGEMFPNEAEDELKEFLVRHGTAAGAAEGLLMKSESIKEEYPGEGPAVAYLNIYNLASEKSLDKVGIGLYHTGIELYGKEWGFGGSSDPEHQAMTGVFWIQPKTATPHFMKQIVLGETRLSQMDLYLSVIKPIQTEWTINTYHVMKRNCNHFSDFFCQSLNLKRPPAWVNRAARWGDTLVPDRLVNYFLNREEVPEAVPRAESKLKERKRKNKKRFWQKAQPEIVGEYEGVVYRIGDNVKYSIVAGVKEPAETGHTKQVFGEPPVRGMVIIGAVEGKWDVVKLHYPRQVFREVGTFDQVTLGPFESTCHVSYLQKEEDEGRRSPSPPPPPSRKDPRANYSIKVSELSAILPYHSEDTLYQALTDNHGDAQLALDAILSSPMPRNPGEG
eukprot:TRINITY_DN3765_c0_g4_i1.p1 TRINITY_DN3765_c0_g4~~TRINITY_DN3765_c0_g4_i1.p1  ORF type:complete len:418 (+),score=51.97 TRINITY_DN3765_c0_g4_i1:60-1313(+)